MPSAAWIAVDLTIVVAALLVLVLLSYTLWRQVGTLGRDIARLGKRIDTATAGLADALAHRR